MTLPGRGGTYISLFWALLKVDVDTADLVSAEGVPPGPYLVAVVCERNVGAMRLGVLLGNPTAFS